MKTKSNTLIVVALLTFGCGSKRDQSNDGLSGTYVREYSFPVVNQETGVEIGMRTVRDSIFIDKVESGYQVSNRKWKLNDYEKDGWRNMEHDEDGPMSRSILLFDRSSLMLRNSSTSVLFVNAERNAVSKSETFDNSYQKIK